MLFKYAFCSIKLKLTHLTSSLQLKLTRKSPPLSNYHSYGNQYKGICFALLSSLSLLSQAATPDGDEFQVNTYETGNQIHSSVSSLNNGGFVVTWMSKNQDGDNTGIFAQRYQADGSADGNEFQVNTSVVNSQSYPSVSGLNDGGFFISWMSGLTGNYDIYAQRYLVDGSPDGGEFQVNTYTTDTQGQPSVSSLNNGGFIVTWVSNGQDGDGNGIYAQRYQANGSTDGEEFQVNTYVQNSQNLPSVSSLSNGGFIISWESYGQESEGSRGVYAQLYLPDGTPSGDEFKVNTSTAEDQGDPSVSSLNNGGFIITWHSLSGDFSIYAQRYLADGTPDGGEFKVNTFDGNTVAYPSVSGLNNGGFVVSWTSFFQDGFASFGVYAQSYKVDGSPDGNEFKVNTYVANTQSFPSVSSLHHGGFVISWNSGDQDTDGSAGTYAQRYLTEQAPYMILSELPAILYEGEQVMLNIEVGGDNIYGIDGVLDSSLSEIVKFVDSQYADFFSESERIGLPSTVTDAQWNGALTLQAPAQAKTGSGTFANVTLQAGNVGTVNLVLNARLVDQQGELLLENSISYPITVIEAFNITGNVADLGFFGDYSNVTVLVNGIAVNINPDGSFLIKSGAGEVVIKIEAEGHLSAEKQVILTDGQSDIDFGAIKLIAGDTNGDGKIDIGDLTMLLGAYRTKKEDNNGYISAADFNRDNQVNIQDLSILGSHFGMTGLQTW